MREFGVESGRIPGLTGVWLDIDDEKKARKICALGVKTSRWVTMHGFALNVNTDLSYFNKMIPCGITDKAVTSLDKEIGRPVDMNRVKEILKKKIGELFRMELTIGQSA
jgi:lipoyl(octanoyl) transferase